MSASLHDRRPAVTRNRVDRFASRLAEERRADDLLAALRASLLSTCQADRSAVQHVADVFRVDPSTVYRWTEGELACRPARDFLDLLDACIAAKGESNPAALELARLIQRRYLDPQPAEREVTPALLTGTAAQTMEAVGSLLSSLLGAVDPSSPGGVALSLEECAELAPRFEAVAELVESLRLVMPACVRRVPISAERPS